MKLFKYILLTLTALIFVGCNLFTLSMNDKETGSLSVVVSEESRTITPSISMNITSYDISGAGPLSSAFGPENTTDSSFSKGRLLLGDWTITVQGKNSSGDIIAVGSGSVTLSSGSDASVTIDISPLTDSGTFEIVMDWPSGALTTPVVNAKFGLAGETLDDITISISGDSATFPATSYSAGYYTLILDVLDGNSPRTSIVETVRIVSDNLTEANLSLTADELSMKGLAPVQFSLDAGEYGSSQSLTLITVTSGATIKYTNNGSVPTETTGIEYTGPIGINSTQTIKAMAFKDGYNNSSVTIADYTITGSIPVPTVNLNEGLYYTSQSLELTVPTGDYTVIYTTDGSEPSLSPLVGSVYSSPVTLNTETSYNIKAKTFNTGNPAEYSDLIAASYNVTGVVADPIFSLSEGTYNINQILVLSTTTSGASIYYTTDGSIPSATNGTLFSVDMTVDGTKTIKAIAIKDNRQSSNVVSSTYTLSPVAPSLNLTGGTYNSEKSVSLTTTSTDYSIYYTLDGSEPSSSSNLYASAITIDQSYTLKAITVPDNGNWSNSTITSEIYTLKPLTPTFSIEPNSYSDASFTVDFLCGTEGVTYTYTIDGSTPVSGSNGYTGSSRFIAVDTNLKVIASKIGWDDSEVLFGDFYPNSTTVSPANGVEVTGEQTLTFPATINGTFCSIEFDDSSDFSSLLESRSDLTTNSHTITTSLTSGTTYYWRYKIYDGSTWSNWSITYSFATKVLAIGDSYGGGIVFYLDGNDGGLIAAPSDQSTGIQWYNGSLFTTGAKGTAIGTGQSNTTTIIAAQGSGSYATKLCDDLAINGYDDWFLPSKDELNQMYLNRATIGGFSSSYYWSSSEYDTFGAWGQSFSNVDDGYQSYPNKDNAGCVRAIRAF